MTAPTTIEDQVGDIILKACRLERVHCRVASLAAEVPWEEFAALIAPKRTVKVWDAERRVNFANLAALLRLDAAKLSRMAATPWSPRPRTPSDWPELRMIHTRRSVVGQKAAGTDSVVNAYLVWDPGTKEAALFDPGWESSSLIYAIESAGVDLRHVFLTHAHKDHTEALAGIITAFPRAVVRGTLACSRFGVTHFVSGAYSIGSLTIECRSTPGHTEDDVTYVVRGWCQDRPPVAIVGDTLLAGTLAIGWTDWAALKANVRDQILTLDGDTLVCPGHGPLTTVAEQLAVNPFF